MMMIQHGYLCCKMHDLQTGVDWGVQAARPGPGKKAALSSRLLFSRVLKKGVRPDFEGGSRSSSVNSRGVVEGVFRPISTGASGVPSNQSNPPGYGHAF